MQLSTKNIFPMWWGYLWRSTVFTFTGWTVFLTAYFLIAHFLYGPDGHKYIIEHKEIGLRGEKIIELAVNIPAFLFAFRKYASVLKSKGIALNAIQQMGKQDIILLYGSFLGYSFLYILPAWLFLNITLKTLLYFNILPVDDYLSSYSYIDKISGYILWLVCSIPALKVALNRRLFTRQQKTRAPSSFRK